MRKFAMLVVLVVIGATPAFSQVGLSPLLQELSMNRKGHAAGSFIVMNQGLTPVNIEITPKQISFDQDGKETVAPVSPHVHVNLSEMGGRIAPKQNRSYFFDVQSDDGAAPALGFFILTSGAPTKTGGVLIRIGLAETCYFTVSTRPDEFTVSHTADSVTVISHAQGYARPMVEMHFADGSKSSESFPLLAGGVRTLQESKQLSSVSVSVNGHKLRE